MGKDGKVRTLEEEGVKFPSSEFLEADKHVHARAYGPFVDDLKKLKNEKGFDAELRENLTEFMEEHPMVHGAARDFIEQNGLKFSVPESPEGVSGEIADKMKSVDDVLRKELKIPQKQQPQQQKEKTAAINDPKLENDATKPQAAAPGM